MYVVTLVSKSTDFTFWRGRVDDLDITDVVGTENEHSSWISLCSARPEGGFTLHRRVILNPVRKFNRHL